jgi:hypothetical protein
VAELEFDDPQIWTVEELLQSERAGIVEMIEDIGKEDNPDPNKIRKLLHVIEYLDDRLAGKFT